MLVDDLITSFETELRSYKAFKGRLRPFTIYCIATTTFFVTGTFLLVQLYFPYLMQPSTMLAPLVIILGYAIAFIICLPLAFKDSAKKYHEKILAESRGLLKKHSKQLSIAITKKYIEFTNNLIVLPSNEKQMVSDFVEQNYPNLMKKMHDVCKVFEMDLWEMFDCSTLVTNLNEFRQSLLFDLNSKGRTSTRDLADKLGIEESKIKEMLQSAIDRLLIEGYLTENEFITREKLKEEIEKEIES